MSATPDEQSAAPPPHAGAVFRISPLVMLVALTFAVCATPVALSGPYLWLVYLVPIGIIGWTLRVRTTVDADALTVRHLLRGRRVPWAQISSLRLRDRARVSAVLSDGAELPLPAVHVRDLPRLAAASGGHLPDPAGE
ncbi:MAG: PH domain-containing protein [Pseudonocardia sp.]